MDKDNVFVKLVMENMMENVKNVLQVISLKMAIVLVVLSVQYIPKVNVNVVLVIL